MIDIDHFTLLITNGSLPLPIRSVWVLCGVQCTVHCVRASMIQSVPNTSSEALTEPSLDSIDQIFDSFTARPTVCKSCIVQYLMANKCCPICDKEVHHSKPLESIRSDKILQDIVYKLIPNVFKNEMKRRRDFYSSQPEAVPASAEDSGQLVDHHMFYMANDKISLSLEYGYGDNQVPENGLPATPSTPAECSGSESDTMKRYLLCPAGLSVLHLKKFIARKYGLPTTFKVSSFRRRSYGIDMQIRCHKVIISASKAHRSHAMRYHCISRSTPMTLQWHCDGRAPLR